MAELNFDSDFTSDVDVVPIAEAAWNKVRGKDDAAFRVADGNFQRILLAHARSALKTNPLAGETNLARFEQEVANLQRKAK